MSIISDCRTECSTEPADGGRQPIINTGPSRAARAGSLGPPAEQSGARGGSGRVVGQHQTPTPPGNGRPAEDRPQYMGASMLGWPLIVELPGETRQVYPAQLQEVECCEQLSEELDAVNGQVVFDLQHLLDWNDTDRWSVEAFIAGLDCDYAVRAREDEYECLFEAVLAAMEGNENVARCGRGILAAVEAAVLVHRQPHALPAACDRIAARLTDLRVRGYTPARLLRQAERLAADSGQHGEVLEEPVAVCDVLPEAPVPDGVNVPAGWEVSDRGILPSASPDDTVIIAAPMVITRRFTDVDGEAEHLGVAWPRDGRWHEEIVPRATVADSRAVIKLATHGAPVTSNNARGLVQYLADFEAHNLEVLPRAVVTQQLGWQGNDGDQGFLWGHELIRAETVSAISMVSDTPSTDAPEILFRGGDEGDNQLADGYRLAGSFEEWQNAVQSLGDFPRVKLALYAALTAPLLNILQAPNFVVSLSGATSQGKTITQRIAASCWGCPDERTPGAVLATWDATRVFIERACEAQNDLPLLLDDTKRAKKQDDIARTLYDVTAGRGRGRGSLDGIRGVGTFRTVMISSGESQITSFSQDGGTRPRVLELWGSPFGRADTETARLVSAVNEGILENYGHVGPRFVQFLMDNRDRWPAWREHYRRLRDRYAARADGNSVAARMASHFAAIRITAILVHLAIELPWGYRDVVTELWPELTAEAPEADRAAVALRYVLSWSHSNRDRFFGQASAAHAPTGGWAGRWDGGNVPGGDAWEYLGFLPHVLDEVLCEGGFEPAPTRRLWKDRDWLLVCPGRNVYRARMGANANPYLVAIRRTAIEQFEEPDEASGHPFPRLARDSSASA